MFNIETSTLSDEEHDRILQRYPHLSLDPEKFCPTCHKSGSYTWHGTVHSCNCIRQLALHKHYLAAGIGLTYQRLDWSDYEYGEELLIKRLGKYVLNHEAYVSRGVGLFLLGSFGTGKTLLANLVLKEFVKKGYSCFATTFADTITAFTAGWTDADEKKWFAHKFIDSQVLLLDDLGKEFRSKNNLAESTFDSILRTRNSGGRPTFLTTNMSLVELESGYGSAILSLLKENSIYAKLSGDDFRPRANWRTLAEVDAGEMRPIC